MTSHTTIQTEGITTLHTDAVGGDLRIRAHDRDEVIVRSEQSGSYSHSQQDEGEGGENIVHLKAFGGDCHIHVPHQTNLHLGAVGGDASIHGTGGELECKNIGGDLKIKQIGRTHIGSVGGDLRIQHVGGELSVESVGGDASVLDCQGNVHLPGVGGDLALSNVQGRTIAARAGGDAVLRLAPVEGSEIHVHANGDINCILPPDTNATVHLESDSHTFRIHGWDVPQPTEERTYQCTLGNGEGSLTLTAHGDISLVVQDASKAGGGPFGGEFSAKWEHDFDFRDFNPHFEFEFDSNMADRFGHLSEEMAQRVQEKVQKAMRQAETKVAEAMRRAEERIARAEEKAAHMEERRHNRERERSRRHERHTRHYRGTAPVPPTPPRPPVPPSRPVEKTVSDEERMMVLRMVEEGKISIEQAEQLLAALKK